MYALKGTPSFRRKYIKLIKNNKELETRINMVLLQFVKDPWHRSLKIGGHSGSNAVY